MLKGSTVLPGKLEAAALPRICSGACPFFTPIYERGRKIAGKGTCANHASDAATCVGTPCHWKLTRYSRRHALAELAN